MFGAILLVAVAVAVSVGDRRRRLAAMAPATSRPSAPGSPASSPAPAARPDGRGGAIGGAVGSIASQAFGVATGLQDKFSWKGVAMAAIGGAVGAGVGVERAFARVGIGTFVRQARCPARPSGSALTQGIGVAAGLQKKFDFAGVAAAGIGGGVASQRRRPAQGGLPSDLTARQHRRQPGELHRRRDRQCRHPKRHPGHRLRRQSHGGACPT